MKWNKESRYRDFKLIPIQKFSKSSVKLVKLSMKSLSKHLQNYFDGEESFKLEDGIEGTYFVPCLGSTHIKFAPQYEFLNDIALTFGYNSEFRKRYDLSDYKFRLIKQSFRRADNVKNFISFRQDLSGVLEREIKERKLMENSSYLNLCSQSVSYFVRSLINSCEDKTDHQLNKDFWTLSIKNFPWDNNKLIANLVDNHFEGRKQVDGVKLDGDNEWSDSLLTYTQWYWAEYLFGSYSQLFNRKATDQKEQNLIKALIIKRSNAIVDYIKHFQISPAVDNNFSESRWNYIFHEIVDYEKIVNTTDRTKIEKEFAIEEVKAKQDGFDAIFGIESCYGMMKVLNFRQYYWSIKSFLNQKALEDFIGKGMWKENLLKSKHY